MTTAVRIVIGLLAAAAASASTRSPSITPEPAAAGSAAAAAPSAPEPGLCSIAASGAVSGESEALAAANTKAINAAISSCHTRYPHAAVVSVPRGVWRTGSINLTSNLTLSLSAGATLLSTNDEAHYGQVPCLPNESREPIRNQGFIACWNCTNTAIEGAGGGPGGSTIDGNGPVWNNYTTTRRSEVHAHKYARPFLQPDVLHIVPCHGSSSEGKRASAHSITVQHVWVRADWRAATLYDTTGLSFLVRKLQGCLAWMSNAIWVCVPTVWSGVVPHWRVAVNHWTMWLLRTLTPFVCDGIYVADVNITSWARIRSRSIGFLNDPGLSKLDYSRAPQLKSTAFIIFSGLVRVQRKLCWQHWWHPPRC
jgi:hypothetical protein